MSDFQTVLTAAQRLTAEDRVRLIDALWETMSPDEEAFFSPEWAEEIERRVAELNQGAAKTIGWSTIREEALARIGHGRSS